MTEQEQRLLQLFNMGHKVQASNFRIKDGLFEEWTVEYPDGSKVVNWFFDRSTNQMISKNW